VRGFVHEKTTVKHQTIGNFPTGRSPHLPESLGKNADGSVNPPTLEPTMPVLSHLRLAGSESVINQVNGFVYIGCQLSPIVCR
jgi:hypothetical protein